MSYFLSMHSNDFILYYFFTPVAPPTPKPIANPTPNPIANPTPQPIAKPTPIPTGYQ
jgi:hypothetical protein